MFQFPDEVMLTAGGLTLQGGLATLKPHYAQATELVVPEEFEPQYNGQLDLALVMMPKLTHLEIYCPVYSLPPLVSVTHLVIPDLRMEQLPPMPELVSFEQDTRPETHKPTPTSSRLLPVVRPVPQPTRHAPISSSHRRATSASPRRRVPVRYDEEWKNLSRAEMRTVLPEMRRYLLSYRDTIISDKNRADLIRGLTPDSVEQYRDDLAAAVIYAEAMQLYHGAEVRQ